jgi:hypothetical protein
MFGLTDSRSSSLSGQRPQAEEEVLEIRRWCSRLASTDILVHTRAYGFLVDSRRFMAVADRLRRQGYSLHEVAALLAESADSVSARCVLELLEEQEGACEESRAAP